MINRFYVLLMTAGILFELLPSATHASSQDDHLVPVGNWYGSNRRYRQLWQQKLLVTSGEVARFVHLPALKGVETTMSIYRVSGKGMNRSYQITTTQPATWLWQLLQPSAKTHSDPWTIRVTRLDAPLPASTALAIHKLWVAMLRRTQRSSANAMEVDSDSLIFSATDQRGMILEGRADSLEGNTGTLADIAGRLIQYCDASPLQRRAKAHQIEKLAVDTLKRIQ